MYARLHAPHESPFHAISRWAASQPAHLHLVLFWSGMGGATGVLLINPSPWPVAVGMLALAGLGGWGLLEHRLAEGYRHTTQVAEWVVATLVVVAALVATFVALLVFMGPAPHF